jgi:hypothetical protein
MLGVGPGRIEGYEVSRIMKLPNFRLYDTQATTSLLVGFCAVLCIGGLAVVALKGLNLEQGIIPYNNKGGMSMYRPYAVMGAAVAAVLLGATACILGFRSLGEKRNNNQGRSVGGMLLGALAIPLAIVLFATWRQLAEPLIQ